MAKQPEQERGRSSIARAGKRKWGYDVGQVDAFLDRAHTLYEDAEPKLSQEDIQNVSFATAKGGYVISQVDAALNRLEKAVVDKQTQWDISTFGRVAWRAATDQLAHSLYGRAGRPSKSRFDVGDPKHPSYDRKQVDRLVDQVVSKIKHELGESKAQPTKAELKAYAELNSTRITNVIFTQRTGEHGYSERQVDAYLNRVIQVLSRLESFARLEGSLGQSTDSEGVNAAAEVPAVTNAKGSVSDASAAVPGVAAATVPAATPVTPSFSPQGQASGTATFSDLHKAETEIFNAGVTASDGTPASVVSNSLAGLVNAAASSTADDGNSNDSNVGTDNAGGEASNQPTENVEATATQAFSMEQLLQDEPPLSEVNVPNVSGQQPEYAAPQAMPTEPISFPVASPTTQTGPAADQQSFFNPASTASAQQLDSDTTTSGKTNSVEQPLISDDTKPAVAETKSNNADDYFASLLDTGSIPSVDFHIPNLTFPSIDESEEKKCSNQ